MTENKLYLPDGITVMLVDSSATSRYYFAILLKRLDFRVLVADSAEEAFAVMKDHRPSIIMTDIALPGMGAVEFIKTVKRSPQFQDIPVIMLSDREDANLKATCAELGCYACLVKHVEPGVLYKTVQQALAPTPRAHIRINVPLKVVVGDGTSQGGAERTEYTTSLSEGGLYLRTLFPRERGSRIPVKIFIRERSVQAQATVVYNRSMERGVFREPGMGVKFLEISQSDRNYVRHFIKEQLTSDLLLGL